jgi:hypothetical protein
MRAVWSSPNATTLQGQNNAPLVRELNSLKKELQTQQNSLLVNHQDETVIDGGNADSIMFHIIAGQIIDDNLAVLATTAHKFDANRFSGNIGTSSGPAYYRFDMRQ